MGATALAEARSPFPSLWQEFEEMVLKPHANMPTSYGFQKPRKLDSLSYELRLWPGVYMINNKLVVEAYGWYPAAVTTAFQRYQDAVATANAHRQKKPKTLAEIRKFKQTKKPAFVLARVPGKRTKAAVWLYGTKAVMASVTAKSFSNDCTRKWELRPANNLAYLKTINPQATPRSTKVEALCGKIVELMHEFEDTV